MILTHMIKNLDHFVNDYLDTEKSLLRHQGLAPTHTVGKPLWKPVFFSNISCVNDRWHWNQSGSPPPWVFFTTEQVDNCPLEKVDIS